MRTLTGLPLGFCLAFFSCLAANAGQPDADAGRPRADAYGDPLPDGAMARLGTERLVQHRVNYMVLAPNRKMLATAGPGYRATIVYVWDVATGKRLQRWEVAEVMGNFPLVFSPDSRHVALGCSDKVVRVWDTTTSNVVSIAARDFMYAVVFAPDSRSLATFGPGGVRVYEFPSGKLVHQLAAAAQPGQLAFSADSKTLIAVGHDQPDRKVWRIHCWDATTGRLQDTRTFESFSNYLGRLAPDGRTLIVPDPRAPGTLDPVGLRRWTSQPARSFPVSRARQITRPRLRSPATARR